MKEIQLFAAIAFFVVGVSHIAQPKGWVEFFQALGARGIPGAFLEGFLLVNFGALIVAFHNVWRWPEVVLTLVGWAQLLKGVGRFVAPRLALRLYQSVSPERAWHFQAGGIFALILSAFLFWLRLR